MRELQDDHNKVLFLLSQKNIFFVTAEDAFFEHLKNEERITKKWEECIACNKISFLELKQRVLIFFMCISWIIISCLSIPSQFLGASELDGRI